MTIFLTLSAFILSSWTDYFSGSEIKPNIYGYTQIDQYKILTAGNFYFFHVTFATVTETTGNGGAIYIDAGANLLVESSEFFHCHSHLEGGAIYFANGLGKSFLKKICSTNSYASASFNHFCYIYTKSSDQCTNCLEQSSVAYLTSTTYYNVNFGNSDIIVLKNDNISKNECSTYSAFLCSPSVSGSVSYTTFENNTSTSPTDSDIIYLSKQKDFFMNLCNVIGNTAKRSVLWLYGTLQISNSCLIENVAPMFFIYNACTCTIINCTIDNEDVTGGGSVNVDSSKTPSNSFINKLDNNACFSMNDQNSMCKCRTLIIKGERCNMWRKRKFDIFLII